jgi:hypothetical protein
MATPVGLRRSEMQADPSNDDAAGKCGKSKMLDLNPHAKHYVEKETR